MSSKKREAWERRIKEWESSSETQASYCRKNSLSLATFKYWRDRVRDAESIKSGESFVRVCGSESVELVHGSVVLKIPNTTPASWVAELLRHAQS